MYRTACVSFFLVLTAMLSSSCPQMGGGSGGGPPEGFKMPPTATIVEPVVQIDYAPAIELVGEVKATQRATLSAEVAGQVVRIAHRVGEPHAKGSGPLVQINTADYEAQLAQAQAGLNQAREQLRMAQNGARPQEIAAQRAQVDAAAVQYKQALDNLERQRELYEQGVIAESLLISAQSQADSAKAALEAQEELLDKLLEGSREEELAMAQAAVDAAQGRYDAAAIALGKTAIQPAFDAVVTDLFVEVGSFVGPGAPVAEVVADGPGEAWFNLPEADINAVHSGDLVELRFDALPETVIAGTVISVSKAADEKTRQFPVRVSIDDERPLPGMVAYGRILTKEPVPTLMVKRDAVVLTNLGEVVFVMQPPAEDAEPFMEGMPAMPTVNMVLVQTGDTLNDLVVVTGDLAPMMMVVTRGNEQLQTGSSIIPTNLMGEGGAGGPGGPPSGMAPPAGMEDAAPPADAEGALAEESAAAEGASK